MLWETATSHGKPKEMCAENVFNRKCASIHRIPRTPGCRRDTSGRSLLHDHFFSKDLSEEKEERQEKAYLGGI